MHGHPCPHCHPTSRTRSLTAPYTGSGWQRALARTCGQKARRGAAHERECEREAARDKEEHQGLVSDADEA